MFDAEGAHYFTRLPAGWMPDPGSTWLLAEVFPPLGRARADTRRRLGFQPLFRRGCWCCSPSSRTRAVAIWNGEIAPPSGLAADGADFAGEHPFPCESLPIQDQRTPLTSSL